MRTITEEIIIKATPVEIWNFLTNLHRDDNYKKWHPKDHIAYVMRKSSMGKVGGIAYFSEHVGKFTLKLSYTLTQTNNLYFLEYKAAWPLSWLHAGKGTFTMEPIDNQTTRFIAYAEYGYDLPIIGKLIDRIVEKIIKYDDARKHMHEEGENLKAILER